MAWWCSNCTPSSTSGGAMGLMGDNPALEIEIVRESRSVLELPERFLQLLDGGTAIDHLLAVFGGDLAPPPPTFCTILSGSPPYYFKSKWKNFNPPYNFLPWFGNPPPPPSPLLLYDSWLHKNDQWVLRNDFPPSISTGNGRWRMRTGFLHLPQRGSLRVIF